MANNEVTMQSLRILSEARLQHALDTGEEGVEVHGHGTFEYFQTDAGVEITRYAGGEALSIECDFSELGHESDQVTTRIEFVEQGAPPQVTKERRSEKGVNNRTVPRHRHDEVAAEIAKYITLIV